MAKTILVDFRGGVNERISPHMIGDSQGQAGNNLDLSAVRLQGRRELDETDKAQGTYYYEVGTATGRWVSTDPNDSTAYDFATDFAVWNRDLYVAKGLGDATGEIDVYRDNGDEPLKLSFKPPAAASATGGFPTNTLLEPVVTGQDAIDPEYDSITVNSGNGGTLQWGTTSGTLHTYEPTTTVASGKDAIDNSKTWYIWQKKNASGTVVSNDFYCTRSTAGTDAAGGGNVSLYARRTGVVGQTFYLGDDWNEMGWLRSNWSERSNHPGAPSTAPDLAYYKFTKSGETDVYQQAINKSFHTISSGGEWSTPAIVREDPNYSADTEAIVTVFNSYRVKWERNTINENRNDADNVWEIVIDQKTGEVVSTTVRYTKLDGTVQVKTLTAGELYFIADDGMRVTKLSALAGNIERLDQAYNLRDDTDNSKDPDPISYWVEARPLDGSLSTYAAFIDDIWILTKESVADRDELDNDLGHQIFRGDYVEQQTYSGVSSPYPGGHTEYLYKIPRTIKWKYQINVRGEANDGTASWMWNSTNIGSESGVTEPSGPIVSGSYTYKLGVFESNYLNNYISTDDVKYYRIYREHQPADVYNNIVWASATEPTLVRDSTFYYDQEVTDYKYSSGQAYIPDTPAYDRDWSRYKLYHTADADDTQGFTEGMWETDASIGTSGSGWLLSGSLQRLFVNEEDGYFLRTVRVENGLPVQSQEKTKVTVTGFNPASGVTYLPRRLNFSITNPTDHNASSWLCWQLMRTDTLGSDLIMGYFKPTPSISLSSPSGSGTTRTMSLSGLSNSKAYRIKWDAYLGAKLTVGAVTSDIEVGGVEITGQSSQSITLTLDSTNHWGFDIWVEERLLQPSTESSAGDIWAFVRCFDGYYYNGTNDVAAAVVASDYLDIFTDGVSTGGLSSGYVQEYPPPTYLKFLRESNNFFFAVGTSGTPDNRYTQATVNKSDSYLFISRYNNPRDWPLDGFLEFEDSITGLHGYPGEIIVWTANATYRVFGSAHNAMRKVKLATTEGMPPGNHKTAVQVNQYLIWLSSGGVCVYDGSSVQNISKTRFTNFSIGTKAHAGQFEGVYYLCDSTETGWQVNTNLEGFPMVECDLREGKAALSSNSPDPVLVYRPRTNRLYSRRGMVAVKGTGDQTDRNTWSYTTRAFDGGAYGRMKLIHSIEINSENCTGQVQIQLDGLTSSNRKNAFTTPKTISFADGYPITIYLPANSIADTWSVELTNMQGQVDYIACEYEVL